jgi:signal transduction histidine kinase
MTGRPPLAFLAKPAEPEVIRRQESVLILLNLGLLAAIAVAHVLFGPVLGTPGVVFFVVLMGRFLMQTVELAWLRGGVLRPSGDVLLTYVSASIWVNVAFAFTVALVGGKEETHYVVLMVIPVVAAAFRYTPLGIAVVVAVTTGLTFLEVAIYYRRHATMGVTEYFEATNVVLVYAVVATVVAFLVVQLRGDRERLRTSLAELESTRDRLVNEEKLAAVGRFASAIAHEVRNPVAMIGSALALARDGAEAGQREQWYEVANQEARRLEALTGDFLAYARQRKPDRQPAPAATTVGYVAEVARARLAEAGLEVGARCEDGVVAAFDPFQIQQALLNLVVNAGEATPAGGRITVGARPAAGGGVEFFVENSGPAIAADVVPKLFEPFFTTKPRGSGLGLAISRTIARAHDGDLTLEANEPGLVRFVLNVAAPAAGG